MDECSIVRKPHPESVSFQGHCPNGTLRPCLILTPDLRVMWGFKTAGGTLWTTTMRQLLSEDRASLAAHMLAHMGGRRAGGAAAGGRHRRHPLGLLREPCGPGGGASHNPRVRGGVGLARAGDASPLPHRLRRGRGGEQASFLAAGMILWRCLPRPAGLPAAGAFALLSHLDAHDPPRRAHRAGAPSAVRRLHRYLPGLQCSTPAQDQHLGGVLMLLIGAAVYLAGGLALLARASRGGTRSRAMKLRRRHFSRSAGGAGSACCRVDRLFQFGASSDTGGSPTGSSHLRCAPRSGPIR